MPERTLVQRAAWSALRRWPRGRALALGAADVWCQVALFPFRRRRRTGRPREDDDRTARTDAFNAAAERYFAKHAAPDYLLAKPFGDAEHFPKHLIDAGVLASVLRLAPGDVVLELGCGSGWLSHLLNRFGCTTIAADVSPTAVTLARRLFEQDPRTNWTTDPQFVAYDGRRLPLDDASCDRVVINDAFHHVPNQREILSEIVRVLKPDGVLAMSEPGRGHGGTERSQEETDNWGVLENELVLEDLAALATACGFRKVNVVASSPFVLDEIPARELGAFMGGRGFAAHWKRFCSALEQHHYIVCHKAPTEATTARPSTLAAAIATVERVSARAGAPVRLRVDVTNVGDTRWIGGERAVRGWTRLGAHLFTAGTARDIVDLDWWRGPLPASVEPGATVPLDIDVPAPERPGAYLLVFDLVVEGAMWFAERGSKPAALYLSVE